MIKLKYNPFTFFKLFIVFIIICNPLSFIFAKNIGDLTRQEHIEINISMMGKVGEQHYYLPNKLIFKTGKLYKLTIKNLSDSKHYFQSMRFSKSIFTRKIQLNKNKNKIAEVKGIINEIEVYPNNEIEWWFIPIKTGIFEDLHCYIKDSKTNKKHSEMGMNGVIVIE